MYKVSLCAVSSVRRAYRTEEDLTVATVADFHDDPKASGKSAHETETPELDDEGMMPID